MKNKYYFKGYEEETENPKIVCKENKSKFIGINEQRKLIFKIKVDDMKFKGYKCDWLLINTEMNNAFFIELKGSDIEHGIEQIENSIIIISSKYTITTKLQQKQVKFIKKTKSTLTIKNRIIKADI